jgi:putative ABC transport system substrate-binding protein
MTNSKKGVKKKIAVLALCAMVFALCSSADAQHSKKMSRIGFIGASSAATSPQNLEAFRQGLRDLHYVEGENMVIEVRWAEGSVQHFPPLIAELIGLNVDVLLVSAAAGALAAKNAGITTPVVFAAVTDPIGYGIIHSSAPNENVFSSLSSDIGCRRYFITRNLSMLGA